MVQVDVFHFLNMLHSPKNSVYSNYMENVISRF